MFVVEPSSTIKRNHLYRCRKIIKQSNLLIISEHPLSINLALDSVLKHRKQLENYINRNPLFKATLYPIKLLDDAPLVARMAADAAEIADVGPMAAIPGALADLMVDAMKLYDPKVRMVENGGEIAAWSTIPLKVGIFAGKSPLSGKVGFNLAYNDFPIGIATSSATVSHALSFGEADAAIIIADTAAMADAAATAICNSVKGPDKEASVQSGLEEAEKIDKVRGALIIRDEFVGKTGNLPQLLTLEGSISDMFKASRITFL